MARNKSPLIRGLGDDLPDVVDGLDEDNDSSDHEVVENITNQQAHRLHHSPTEGDVDAATLLNLSTRIAPHQPQLRAPASSSPRAGKLKPVNRSKERVLAIAGTQRRFKQSARVDSSVNISRVQQSSPLAAAVPKPSPVPRPISSGVQQPTTAAAIAESAAPAEVNNRPVTRNAAKHTDVPPTAESEKGTATSSKHGESSKQRPAGSGEFGHAPAEAKGRPGRPQGSNSKATLQKKPSREAGVSRVTSSTKQPVGRQTRAQKPAQPETADIVDPGGLDFTSTRNHQSGASKQAGRKRTRDDQDDPQSAHSKKAKTSGSLAGQPTKNKQKARTKPNATTTTHETVHMPARTRSHRRRESSEDGNDDAPATIESRSAPAPAPKKGRGRPKKSTTAANNNTEQQPEQEPEAEVEETAAESQSQPAHEPVVLIVDPDVADQWYGQLSRLQSAIDALKDVGKYTRTDASGQQKSGNNRSKLRTTECRRLVLDGNRLVNLIATQDDSDDASDRSTRLFVDIITQSMQLIGSEFESNESDIVQDGYAHAVPVLTNVLGALLNSYGPKMTLESEQLKTCHRLIATILTLGSKLAALKSKPGNHISSELCILKPVRNDILANLKFVDGVFGREIRRLEANIRAGQRAQELSGRRARNLARERKRLAHEDAIAVWRKHWAILHEIRTMAQWDGNATMPRDMINHLRYQELELTVHDGMPISNGPAIPRSSMTANKTKKQRWESNHSKVLVCALQEWAEAGAADKLYEKLIWNNCRVLAKDSKGNVQGPGLLRRYNVAEIVEHAMYWTNYFISTSRSKGKEPDAWMRMVWDPRVPPVEVEDEEQDDGEVANGSNQGVAAEVVGRDEAGDGQDIAAEADVVVGDGIGVDEEGPHAIENGAAGQPVQIDDDRGERDEVEEDDGIDVEIEDV